MKRQSRLHIMLTEEEKTLLVAEAQRQGATVSAWLRLVMRQRLGLPAISNLLGS